MIVTFTELVYGALVFLILGSALGSLYVATTC